jgi:hypothetical protein
MLRRPIKYTDFNGNERTEDFYFNLTKAEIMEMELGVDGGLSEVLRKMVNTQDVKNIVKYFKTIVLQAYGEKSNDGKRFIKIDGGVRLAEIFVETEAYSNLFIELLGDPDKMADFINSLVPADLAEKKAEMQANAQPNLTALPTNN